MKRISIILFLLGSSLYGISQESLIPQNYSLEKAEDYSKYEKEVVKCIEWLEATPLNEQEKLRDDVNTFVGKWINGSPTITVELNANTSVYFKKNVELLPYFLCGWTKHMLQHPEDNKDVVKGNLAGLRSVIRIYQKGIKVKKDKEIEKLIKLENDNKLENWIRDQLK